MNSTSTLVLKQPANLSQLFNQNNTTENHTNKDADNAVQCRYYDIEEIQTLKITKIKASPYLCFILMHALLARVLMS